MHASQGECSELQTSTCAWEYELQQIAEVIIFSGIFRLSRHRVVVYTYSIQIAVKPVFLISSYFKWPRECRATR